MYWATKLSCVELLLSGCTTSSGGWEALAGSGRVCAWVGRWWDVRASAEGVDGGARVIAGARRDSALNLLPT